MGEKSNIEWTDATWNPVHGCSKVSRGCRHCYAETFSMRIGHTSKPWTEPNADENVQLHPERLLFPKMWKRPRKIFVCSMADLFHRLVPDDFILQVYRAMSLEPRHTFQVLTKRSDRMADFYVQHSEELWRMGPWPAGGMLPNVHVGVTVEESAALDRIDDLGEIGAAIRWVSIEPMLGPLPGLAARLTRARVSWAVFGGESGSSRPMAIEWVRDGILACREAGVAVFVKQLGEHPTFAGSPYRVKGKGGDMMQWPVDLRVREFPKPAVLPF